MKVGLGVTSWFLPARGAQAVEWAAIAGFSSLQIDMADVAKSGISDLAAASAATGVALSGLSASTLETGGVHGAFATTAVSEAMIAADKLRIGYMYLPSFGAADIRSSLDLQATSSLLSFAADRARHYGIVVATENALGADGLTKLFNLLERDDVELLFDTQNLAARGIAVSGILDSHRSRIRSCVHVKDGVQALGTSRLGSGAADIAPALIALFSTGFDGQVVIESDYRATSPDDVKFDQVWLHELAARHAPRQEHA